MTWPCFGTGVALPPVPDARALPRAAARLRSVTSLTDAELIWAMPGRPPGRDRMEGPSDPPSENEKGVAPLRRNPLNTMAHRPGLEPGTCGLTVRGRARNLPRKPKISNALSRRRPTEPRRPSRCRTRRVGIAAWRAGSRSRSTACVAAPPNRARTEPPPKPNRAGKRELLQGLAAAQRPAPTEPAGRAAFWIPGNLETWRAAVASQDARFPGFQVPGSRAGSGPSISLNGHNQSSETMLRSGLCSRTC